MKKLLKPVVIFMVGLMASSSATSTFAQTADTSVASANNTENNPDPVFVFNRICYAQVHDLAAIRNMSSKLAWRSMQPEDLEQFKGKQALDILDGWDVQVGERLFRVGITKGAPAPSMAKTFPKLADGKVSTCSIVLDDQQLASEFLPNMQRLVGKEPVSADVPEGLLRTTTWAGGNDELKVFVFAKAPPTGKGGLLNVTILQK